MLDGLPTTLATALLTLLALVPGACFVWGLELQRVRRRGAVIEEGITRPPGERLLAFVVATLGYHLAVGWLEFLLWREHFADGQAVDAGRFAILWAGMLTAVILPTAAGHILGARFPGLGRRAADPWQDAFAANGAGYLRIRTTDGAWIGGFYGADSWAGTTNHDLYLEDTVAVARDGTLLPGSLGYSAYVPADAVAWVDFVPGTTPPEEPEGPYEENV